MTATDQDLLARLAELESTIHELRQMNRVVAHKLKSPLATISGLASLMVLKHSETLAPDVHDAFTRISSEVKNIAGQIDEACEAPLIRSKAQA